MPRRSDAIILGIPKNIPPGRCHSIMRKTVHEWLEANHNGTGMAKKRAARRESLKPRATSISQVEQLLQKKQSQKTKMRKHPK
jgi:hypothetical protein